MLVVGRTCGQLTFFFLSLMDPISLARISAGPPPSPVVMSPEPDAGVTVLTAATAGLAVCAGTSPAARPPGLPRRAHTHAGGSPPPRPAPTGSMPIPGAALRGTGKENLVAVSPPPRAGSAAPYGTSPPSALMGRSPPGVASSPAPVAPYQALPVHGPVTITHHLTAGLPVVEPGEMSKEVRERQRESGREEETSKKERGRGSNCDAGERRACSGAVAWSGTAPISWTSRLNLGVVGLPSGVSGESDGPWASPWRGGASKAAPHPHVTAPSRSPATPTSLPLSHTSSTRPSLLPPLSNRTSKPASPRSSRSTSRL